MIEKSEIDSSRRLEKILSKYQMSKNEGKLDQDWWFREFWDTV
ncbi:MAG TPA: hypothetical protein VIH86_04225 [Puia sp.]|jgi:hypothetical protein